MKKLDANLAESGSRPQRERSSNPDLRKPSEPLPRANGSQFKYNVWEQV